MVGRRLLLLRVASLLVVVLRLRVGLGASRERCGDPGSVGSQLCETCPRGKYRPQNTFGVAVGKRRRECMECPRGRYGETSGLTDMTCTAQCPAGKYSDVLGARTEDDCKLCPPGRYGSAAGLESRACTAACPAGKSSSEWGLTSLTQCASCPDGLRAWQCEDELLARKGLFETETDVNTINEAAHAYIGDVEETSRVTRKHYYDDAEEAAIPQGFSPIQFDSWQPMSILPFGNERHGTAKEHTHKTYDPELRNIRLPTNSFYDK